MSYKELGVTPSVSETWLSSFLVFYSDGRERPTMYHSFLTAGKDPRGVREDGNVRLNDKTDTGLETPKKNFNVTQVNGRITT